MHHCFFCQGLSEFFSDAAAPSRMTGTRPRPAQPSCPPAGADSSGHGLRAPGCRPERSDGPRLGHPAAVPVGLGPVLDRPVQAVLGEAPLDAEDRALGHIQGLGHLGRGPARIGLEQDAGPGRDPDRTSPSPYRMLQLVAFFLCQPYYKFLPDHTATSQQHLWLRIPPGTKSIAISHTKFDRVLK